MKKIITIGTLFFLITSNVRAQITEVEIAKIIPPSPNAQTFLKYGDFPISYFTGIPNINIPIYQIQLQDFNFPISLSYNASGIQVNEDASRTGLGWVLNTGGLISRTIVGGDDFGDPDRYPYFNSDLWDYRMHSNQVTYPVIHGCSWNFTGPTSSLTQWLFGKDNHDLAPDIFNYNFNGYSGSFSFTHNGSIYKQSSDNLVIKSKKGTEKDGFNWEIITPDGTTYTFNQREYHHTQNHFAPISNKQISTWYLSEIKTINGNKIEFKYDVQKTYSFSISGISQEYGYKEGEGYALRTSQPYNYGTFYDIVTLSDITFPNGLISFSYSNERKDQSYEPKLDALTVKSSSNNETVKHVEFKYDYFQSNALGNEVVSIERIKYIIGDLTGHPFYKAISDDWNKFRLKLKGIEIGTDKKEKYEFKYNEKDLPTKLSTARDHWGYYNGKSNIHLIPNQKFNNPLRSTTTIEGGLSDRPANREVDPNYSQAFVLTEIMYPTGGKTTFEYESNRYNTAKFDGDPLRQNYMYEQKRVSIIGTPEYRAPMYGPFAKEFFSISSADCTANGAVTVGFTKRIIFATNRSGLPSSKNIIMRVKNIDTGKIIHESNDDRSFYSFYDNDLNKKEISITIRNLILVPGNYEFEVSGDLREYLDSFYLELTWLTGPETYVKNNPISYAGGLRIHKMASSSNGQILETKSYEYDFNNSILTTNYPRYWNINFTGKIRTPFISSSGLRSHKTPVGYGIVTVLQGNNYGDNGSSVYKYQIKPDKHLDYSYRAPGYTNLPTNYTVPFDHAPVGSAPLTFSYIQNGALLEEKHSKKENNSYSIIKQVNYDYETDDDAILWGIVIPSGTGQNNSGNFENFVCQETNKTSPLSAYLYPAINPQWIRLTKKTEQEITGNNIVEIETSYEYNQTNKQINKQEISDSNNKNVIMKYLYPADIPTNISTELKNNNLVNTILELKKETNGKLQQITYDYKLFGTIPRFSETKTNTSKDQSLEVRVSHQGYDSYGNPLYLVKDDITRTVYLWSYNGQHPIAEIKNMSYTYEEIETIIKSVFSVASIDALSKLISPNETKLKDGTLQNSLPNALVTTYTYKPLVGILTMTDPREVTTHYEYDTFGKLKATYIQEKSSTIKKLLQSYDYHYQNQ